MERANAENSRKKKTRSSRQEDAAAARGELADTTADRDADQKSKGGKRRGPPPEVGNGRRPNGSVVISYYTVKCEFKAVKLEFKAVKREFKVVKREFKSVKREFKAVECEFPLNLYTCKPLNL